MARVCVIGEHLVAKDLRAFVRADADLHLTTPAFARFTIDVRAPLPPGSVVSVDTGPKVSATENAIIAALAQRLKRVLVQCGAGERHEHVVVVSLPADLREQEAYTIAEALHVGLLQAAKVLPKPKAWQRALARLLLASVLLAAAASSAHAQIHQVGGGSSASSAYPAVATASGTLTIAGDSVTIATAGMGTLAIDIPSGSFTGDLIVTGKLAGATSGRTIPVYRATNGGIRGFSPTTSITSTNRAYLADVTGYASVSVTLNTISSGGPITVSLSATPLVVGLSTMTNITDGATNVAVQNTNGITTQGALKVYAVDATDIPLSPLTDTQLRASALDINCLSGCGSPPATSDGTAFTAGTTNVTPIAAVVDDAATTTVAEDAYGAPRMTTNRVLYADLSKTGANTTALKVDGSAVTQPVSGTFWPVTQPVSGVLGVSTLAGTSSSLVLTAANTITVTPTGLSALTWYFAVGGLTGGPAQVSFEASFDNAVSYTQVPFTRLKSTGGTQDGQTTALALSLNTSDSHVVTTIVPPGADHVRVRVTSTIGAGSATVQVAGSASPATYGSFVTLAGTNTVAATQSGTWTVQPGNTANTTAWLEKLDQTGSNNDVDVLTLPANATVNVNQVAGAAVATAASGTLKVGITGNAGAALDAANNAAAPANELAIGLEARSSTPTAATNGNLIRSAGDLAGNQFNVLPISWSCAQDNIAATLTQCQAAPSAGYSLYVTSIVAISTTATAATFALRQGTGSNCVTGTAGVLPGASTARTYVLPANTAAPIVLNMGPVGVKLTAASALCVIGAATNTLNITVSGYTAP
jgi:hypothetical protein